MKFRLTGLFIAATLALPPAAAAQIADSYREVAGRIIAAAQADSAAFDRLAELTDKFGHRLSGSQSLEDAIDWVLTQMTADGLDNVHGEAVIVPHWVRGKESARLLSPRNQRLPMLGLGRSVGTPFWGIKAEVLVVGSFETRRRGGAGPVGDAALPQHASHRGHEPLPGRWGRNSGGGRDG